MDNAKGTEALAQLFGAVTDGEKSDEWCRERARLVWRDFGRNDTDSVSIPSDPKLLVSWLDTLR